MERRKVGILGHGGGQLGRMLAASASLLNIDIVVLDTGDHSPAKQVVSSRPGLEHIDGSFTDPSKILELSSKVDVLTVEIEHINVDILEEIESFGHLQIQPKPSTLRVIQDKLKQKQHLSYHGISVADFAEVQSSKEAIKRAVDDFGLPLMLKSRTFAYDGRGNYLLKDVDRAEEAIKELGGRPLYAERFVPFVKEVAVMVVRSATGDIASYPAVETIHKNNICHTVFAPLRHENADVLANAQKLAEETVRTFQGAGVFGVEMFLQADGKLSVNEVAPRPHNSGHYTIEACYTSQYENHLRAILSFPLGSTRLKVPSAAMLNLLGFTDSMDEINSICRKALEIDGASIHLYGKKECRKGRKMGHITLVGDSDSSVRTNLRKLLQALPDEDPLLIGKLTPPEPASGSGFPSPNPIVGIIMGSDSDLPVMLPAARILDKFLVPYELTIVSAHRTPDRMVEYAESASSRGLRVIIAGAGGAAHLPGMVAAMTALPVIGVPVKGSTLDGVDSLHSIVQMPKGIPVATVAINNSTNAALLAVRILGTSSSNFLKSMSGFLKEQEEEVLKKVEKLGFVGWEQYRNIS